MKPRLALPFHLIRLDQPDGYILHVSYGYQNGGDAMNPNHAELVWVAVREPRTTVSDQPSAAGATKVQLDIIVEGKAGGVLGRSGQPYKLSIFVFDFTAGANPNSVANNFTQHVVERFDAAHGWPDKVATFTVALNDTAAVQGHLLKCYATLTSTNQIGSFVESPLFLLHLGDVWDGSKPQVTAEAVDAQRSRPGSQPLHDDEETSRRADEQPAAVSTQRVAAWLDAYSRAREAHDTQAISTLFSQDATYRYHSWDAPVRGREAIKALWLKEQDAPDTCEEHYETLVVDGELAVATGRIRYLGPDRSVQQQYFSCLVVRFDGADHCTEFTKWYMKPPQETSG